MRRLLGRRVTLLVASALPLLAHEPDAHSPPTTVINDGGGSSSSSSGGFQARVQAQHATASMEKESSPIEGDRDNEKDVSYARQLYNTWHVVTRDGGNKNEAAATAATRNTWTSDVWLNSNESGVSSGLFVPMDDDLYGPYRENYFSGHASPHPPLWNNGSERPGGGMADHHGADHLMVGASEVIDPLDFIQPSAPTEHPEKNSTVGDLSVTLDPQVAEDQSSEKLGDPTTQYDDDTHSDSSSSKTNSRTADPASVKHVAVDYASKSVGALILDSSANFDGASNLLQKDRDKYAIVPCAEEHKFLVVGLSEDILVKEIVLANYERYSSHMRDIRISGSATTAVNSNWVDLGTYLIPQSFSPKHIGLTKPFWARYLKFDFLSHYGDEHYCTVSQISVHGSTVLQGFHEQWEADAAQEATEDITKVSTGASDDDQMSQTHQESNEGENAQEDAVSLNRATSQEKENYLDCPGRLKACMSGRDFPQRMVHFLSKTRTGLEDSGALPLVSLSSCRKSIADDKQGPRITVATPKASLWQSSLSEKGKSHLFLHKDDYRRNIYREFPLQSSDIPILRDAIQRNVALNLQTESSIHHSSTRASTKAKEVNTSEDTSELNQKDPVMKGKDSIDEAKDKFTRHPTQINASDVEVDSVDVSSENSQAKVDVRILEIDEDKSVHEMSMVLAKALHRFPSAKCLESIDVAKFEDSLQKVRAGSGGAGANGNSNGSVEPIFKKLSDEIKILQSNMAVHSKFAKELIQCYQSVLLDMLMEMENERASQNLRISKLESDMRVGTFVASIVRFARRLVYGIVAYMHLSSFGLFFFALLLFFQILARFRLSSFTRRREVPVKILLEENTPKETKVERQPILQRAISVDSVDRCGKSISPEPRLVEEPMIYLTHDGGSSPPVGETPKSGYPIPTPGTPTKTKSKEAAKPQRYKGGPTVEQLSEPEVSVFV